MARTHKAAIGVTLALLGVAAVALMLLRSQARDTAGDVVSLVELGDDPPFRIGLGGPLWRDRILHDAEGAADFARVIGDEPLRVEVRAPAKTGVAEVELRVDGRRQRVVVARCPQGRCPSTLRLPLTPRLRQLPPGPHRVEVVARDPRGAGRLSGPHVSVQGFSVRTVDRAPAVAEGEPIGKRSAPASRPRGDPKLERSALGVLDSERRSGGFTDALGSARLRVVQVGDLNSRGKRLGATMLVELVSPRQDVRANVPAYVPTEGEAGAPYTAQRVRMHVAVLRDALIDIDLIRRRVISFEPGVRSRSLSWSPSQVPAPAGAGDED